MAAAIGQPLNIPVIVRSLGQDMYRIGMRPNGELWLSLELITYLDGNLSSNGLNDPALGISFELPWWNGSKAPSATSYLCAVTLHSALDHFHKQLAAAIIPFGVPHSIRNLKEELNKPTYTWHSSVNNDDFSNPPNHCT